MVKKGKKLKKKAKQLGPPVPLVTELVHALDFTHEGLPEALVKQAKLFFRAAEYRVAKLKVRITADTALKETRVIAAGDVRLDAEDSGIKITEKYVAESVDGAVRVQDAQLELDEAKVAEEYAKLLLDAYQQERFHGQGSCAIARCRSRRRVWIYTYGDGKHGFR